MNSICKWIFGSTMLICISCTPSLDRDFNPVRLDDDLKAIAGSGRLDSAEMMMLRLYITRAAEGVSFENKTYGNILEEARTFQKQNQENELLLRERMEKERRETALHEQERIDAIGLRMAGKGFVKEKWQEYLNCSFVFRNCSAKDIRAFKGSVIFTDLFDEEIYSMTLSCDRMLPAGDTASLEIRSAYNAYSDRDLRFRNKSPEDLKLIWRPEKIIFTDNSTL